MLLPAVEKTFNIPRERSLKGAFIITTPVPLTHRNWISGWYQQNKVLNFNDLMGYKPTLVRLFNQINFSLFNQTHIANIIVGKSGYLYQENYIFAYTGNDKLNISNLKKKIDYIYQVQKLLESKGVHFILIFAPNKARIFPEDIPDRYLSKKKNISNYEEYIQIIDQNFPNLHVLDMNNYFLKLKKTVSVPLYAKGGVHWSNYAVYKYFLDTLTTSMGAMENKRFPRLTEQNMHWTNNLISPDDDLTQTLNLFKAKPNEKLPYADFKFTSDPDYRKPSLLMISDSYYSMLYGSELFNNELSRSNFWYYNKSRYPEDYYNGKNNPSFLRDDLLHHDFVILMATEINIDQMFLFPENVLSWFGLGDAEMKAKDAKREKWIQYYINAIYKNPGWINDIRGQMKKNPNKSLEELVRDNAEYMVKVEHKDL